MARARGGIPSSFFARVHIPETMESTKDITIVVSFIYQIGRTFETYFFYFAGDGLDRPVLDVAVVHHSGRHPIGQIRQAHDQQEEAHRGGILNF